MSNQIVSNQSPHPVITTQRPFFSIGVCTYNRREMLLQNLMSIQAQTFQDFEVIVGNNYTNENLSLPKLAIDDDRINIINHYNNLGRFLNYTSQLINARGRYFTWLNDDDMYTPGFLQSVYDAIISVNYPACVFTDYYLGSTYHQVSPELNLQLEVYTGREFLKKYLERSLHTLGCYAVFDIDYIIKLNGMRQLGSGFGPYGDNFLAIQAGMLETVPYINIPLVFFRAHDQSISFVSGDIEAYMSAQEDLFRFSWPILRSEHLTDDFRVNLYHLLCWCISDFATVVSRSGALDRCQVTAYAYFVSRYAMFLTGSSLQLRLLKFLAKTMLGLRRYIQ